MEKRFARYFGSNIARKLYLLGFGMMVVGLAVAYFYWVVYGMPITVIGLVLFFASSALQISDKDMDTKVAEDVNKYVKEKIDGRTIGKETLDGRDFSVFYGYIRENGGVRFKSGSDKKLRTSSYYVTAISAKKNDCKVFMTVYDLLSPETPNDQMIFTKGADEIAFEKEAIEFPKGNFRCKLRVDRKGETEEMIFFLPDDALAERLLEKFK